MSDFDKLRKFFTSWPCIIVGFCFGGWPGFLLLLWKIAGESDGAKYGRKRGFFRDLFREESTEGMYWDRETQRWVKRDADNVPFDWQDDLDYDDPAASYRYTYRDGRATRVTEEIVPEKQKKKKKKSDDKTQKKSAGGSSRISRFPKIPDGKLFTFAGAVTTVFFGGCSLIELLSVLAYGGGIGFSLLLFLMFTAVGAGLLAWGRFKKKRASEFRRLLQLVGDSNRVSLRTLSDASGLPYRKTCDQLQEMIDAGYLGERAYMNYATGELVLDGTPIRSKAPEQPGSEAPAAETAETADDGDEKRDQEILQKIRAADEAIPDEEMSRKIRRVEEITGHILDYQKKHPERVSDLRKFLNYYLPTTLKLLHTYAELDRQKISGENINATKRRIEGMMDKVVEGFELQLDKLYEDEMLDITSDISVMETMLSQDGLAPSSEMQIPKAPDAAAAAREAAAKEAARQNAARQAATAANAGFTTPEGIHLTLNPDEDAAAGGAAAQAAPRKE